MKMDQKELKLWRIRHDEYIQSTQWRELRRTMPGPRQCAVCETKAELNLHHMYYPQNLFQTLHCHCVWLCRSCHEAFHRRVKGTIPQKNETWDRLRHHTIKIVRRELKRAKTPLPEKIVVVAPRITKPSPHADLKPIPPKPYQVSTAPEYLKALRKQFFKYGGKKMSSSKLRREAKRLAERTCKNKRLVRWFAALPE